MEKSMKMEETLMDERCNYITIGFLEWMKATIGFK
jgi:hypothetical protein